MTVRLDSGYYHKPEECYALNRIIDVCPVFPMPISTITLPVPPNDTTESRLLKIEAALRELGVEV